MLRRISVLSTLLMAASLCACEQSGGTGETSQTSSNITTSDDQKPEPPKPPQEAFDACKSIAEGATCKVAIGDKSVDGTCRKGPDGNGELACVPEPPPPPEHRGAPPEAVDACKSLAENSSCAVKFGDKTVDGTCRKGPGDDATLACAPARMPPPPPPGHHKGPPQEAIDACKSLAENAACTVKFVDKSVAGTCAKGPGDNATLACKPANMGPPPDARGHRGPPQEALDACKSLAEDAACSVKFGDKTLDGRCRKGPGDSGALACAPANMPPPPPAHHHRGPPPQAFEACKSLTENAACTVTFGDESISGTCRKGPDGAGALACAPANMPAPPPPPPFAQ